MWTIPDTFQKTITINLLADRHLLANFDSLREPHWCNCCLVRCDESMFRLEFQNGVKAILIRSYHTMTIVTIRGTDLARGFPIRYGCGDHTSVSRTFGKLRACSTTIKFCEQLFCLMSTPISYSFLSNFTRFSMTVKYKFKDQCLRKLT